MIVTMTLKVVLFAFLYWIFVKSRKRTVSILGEPQKIYFKETQPGLSKLAKLLFKKEVSSLRFDESIYHCFAISFIMTALLSIPYSDYITPGDFLTRGQNLSQDYDLGVILGILLVTSVLYSTRGIKSNRTQLNQIGFMPIMVILFCLTQIGMIYTYGSLNLQEIVVNQEVGQKFFLYGYGAIVNLPLFFSSIVICVLVRKAIFSWALNSRASSETNEAFCLLYWELVCILLIVVIIYLYFGGHSLPVIGEYVQNFSLFNKSVFQLIVLVTKFSLLEAFIRAVSQRIVVRSSYSNTKFIIVIILPLTLFGITLMPMMQYWRS